MIVYTDVITGDEMVSDSYNLQEVDGVAYEVDCRYIQIGGEDFDTGANSSAEDSDGDDDNKLTVIDIVHSFKLHNVPFDKQSYSAMLKDYLRKVGNHLKSSSTSDDEVEKFVTMAGAFAKKIIGNFQDYEFYTGDSLDEGMIVLLNYREDGVTPYVTFWKHGLEEQRV